ncbi:flagellar hook-basal body complex protein [Oxalobacteraceae bacterium]|nr:flagellar hook-basal body complex protein [Oxalobacteraceae bacterium]
MFDTLYIGTSGLLGHAKGLKVVGNNLANVNTPGFKGSQVQFFDLFEQQGGQSSSSNQGAPGTGVSSFGSKLNFKAGTDQSTGNPLDLSITGNSMFTVKRDDKLLYTRAGDFQFDAKNVLTNSAGDHVQALDSSGQLVDVTLDALEHSVPKATSVVTLEGNLTSTIVSPVAVDAALSGVTVIDPAGGSHTVNLSFKDLTGGSYTVTVIDGVTGGAVLGTGTIKFAGSFPVAGSDVIKFNYVSTGVPAFEVKLDFSKKVTSLLTSSTLSLASQDGYVAGVRTDQSIDADGTINVRYSNGQKAKGARLAMAEFSTEKDLLQVGGGAFAKTTEGTVRYGYAGAESFGTLAAGHREGSNVDLAEEFSNLILMQRGYQASSHVISTANDMIQELFDMKGHR